MQQNYGGTTEQQQFHALYQWVDSYCNQIENLVKQFINYIKNDQVVEEQHSMQKSVPFGGTSLPTIQFTPDTKQKFLRAALDKNLFAKLKRISKLWLANVPDEQRRQATRVATAIAKAVTDGRISTITESDLATYRTLIQQSFGRECNVPIDQIRTAFSQKIRVYLQNTKSKHDDWVTRYSGAIDINTSKIMVPENDEAISNIRDNSLDQGLANLSDSTIFGYTQGMGNSYSAGEKRAHLDDVDQPPPTKRTKNSLEESSDTLPAFLDGLQTPFMGASYSQVTTEVLEKEDKE